MVPLKTPNVSPFPPADVASNTDLFTADLQHRVVRMVGTSQVRNEVTALNYAPFAAVCADSRHGIYISKCILVLPFNSVPSARNAFTYGG